MKLFRHILIALLAFTNYALVGQERISVQLNEKVAKLKFGHSKPVTAKQLLGEPSEDFSQSNSPDLCQKCKYYSRYLKYSNMGITLAFSSYLKPHDLTLSSITVTADCSLISFKKPVLVGKTTRSDLKAFFKKEEPESYINELEYKSRKYIIRFYLNSDDILSYYTIDPN